MNQPEKLSGYTPGPWKAVKARTLIHIGGESPICSLSVSTNHMGYEVRTSQELRDKAVRRVEANARLIAAAPLMLETLRDLVEAIVGNDPEKAMESASGVFDAELHAASVLLNQIDSDSL